MSLPAPDPSSDQRHQKSLGFWTAFLLMLEIWSQGCCCLPNIPLGAGMGLVLPNTSSFLLSPLYLAPVVKARGTRKLFTSQQVTCQENNMERTCTRSPSVLGAAELWLPRCSQPSTRPGSHPLHWQSAWQQGPFFFLKVDQRRVP